MSGKPKPPSCDDCYFRKNMLTGKTTLSRLLLRLVGRRQARRRQVEGA